MTRQDLRRALAEVAVGLQTGILSLDMNSVGTPECGTNCCIGGWARHYLALDDLSLTEAFDLRHNPYLAELFCMGPLTHGFFSDGADSLAVGNCTPTQAARAINNFLYLGRPNWLSVLSGPSATGEGQEP